MEISLRNSEGKLITQVSAKQEICIDMELMTRDAIEFPILGFNLKDVLGNELVVTNNIFEKIKIPSMDANQTYRYQWKFEFPQLHAGDYLLDVALAEGTYQNHEQIHFVTDALVIKCVDDRMYQEGRGKIVPKDIRLVNVK